MPTPPKHPRANKQGDGSHCYLESNLEAVLMGNGSWYLFERLPNGITQDLGVECCSLLEARTYAKEKSDFLSKCEKVGDR